MENNSVKKQWWHIYILSVDNRGNKSKYYGHKHVYYTGISTNLARRTKEHLTRKIGFIGTYFKDARKSLVYVEYLFGTKSEAMVRESMIKSFSVKKKEELIMNDSNMLVQYIPFKAIVLKKNGQLEEQVCLKL